MILNPTLRRVIISPNEEHTDFCMFSQYIGNGKYAIVMIDLDLGGELLEIDIDWAVNMAYHEMKSVGITDLEDYEFICKANTGMYTILDVHAGQGIILGVNTRERMTGTLRDYKG